MREIAPQTQHKRHKRLHRVEVGPDAQPGIKPLTELVAVGDLKRKRRGGGAVGSPVAARQRAKLGIMHKAALFIAQGRVGGVRVGNSRHNISGVERPDALVVGLNLHRLVIGFAQYGSANSRAVFKPERHRRLPESC